jgi:hypothetical protein
MPKEVENRCGRCGVAQELDSLEKGKCEYCELKLEDWCLVKDLCYHCREPIEYRMSAPRTTIGYVLCHHCPSE